MKDFLRALLFLLAISCSPPEQLWAQSAEEFIEGLKDESAHYDGIPLNSYFLSDLDRDGVYEIIERTNRIESAYVGLLNTELDGAFTYDKIYVLRDNKYVLSNKDIGRYLELQLSYYELWRRIILNPVNLTEDSKALIKEHKEEFIDEIDFIINEIKRKIK